MGSAPDELNELKEHAEEAAHDRQMAPVSFTMAVLAVLLAICGTLGHRAHTEEGIVQTRRVDAWAYYQFKSERRFLSEMFLDNMSVSGPRPSEQTSQLHEKYQKNLERYEEELKELQAEARKLDGEADIISRRATRFDLGDTFFEIALVITSITLLTRKRHFWALGILFGVLGLLSALSSLLVR